MYMYLYLHRHMYTYVYMYVYMHVYAYVYVYSCVCMCMFAYVCLSVCLSVRPSVRPSVHPSIYLSMLATISKHPIKSHYMCKIFRLGSNAALAAHDKRVVSVKKVSLTSRADSWEDDLCKVVWDLANNYGFSWEYASGS